MCAIPVYTHATTLSPTAWCCQHTATQRNILQHTATHCNTLQHTATHCNNHTFSHCLMRSTHCNTMQHTATHCNTLQHNATYCNIKQWEKVWTQPHFLLLLDAVNPHLYVCMYVCTCVYVCMYIHKYLWKYVCMHVCVSNRPHTYTEHHATCVWTHANVLNKKVYICVHIRMHASLTHRIARAREPSTSTYVHAYKHTYQDTCLRTYIHTTVLIHVIQETSPAKKSFFCSASIHMHWK